eukprot:15473157-Alexandrium_andersonii.AAC.1
MVGLVPAGNFRAKTRRVFVLRPVASTVRARRQRTPVYRSATPRPSMLHTRPGHPAPQPAEYAGLPGPEGRRSAYKSGEGWRAPRPRACAG